MALTLRFLGQATKQTPQVLTALTPRASANSGSTPRTPLRGVCAAGDKSPFFGGETASFVFDTEASSPRAGLLSAAERRPSFDPLARVPPQTVIQQLRPIGVPSGTLLQRLAAHATESIPEIATDSDGTDASESDPESVRQAVLSRKSRVAARGVFRDATHAPPLRVLLGRETLSQQSRPEKGAGRAGNQSAEQMAQAAHQAFLHRQAAQTSRFVAARM